MAGYGIAGAHRSGKTTLARAAALTRGIEYLDANVSKVITDLGYTPKQELPFEERLKVQNAILESLRFKYAMMGDKDFITDRTPLDVLGYTFAEVTRTTLTPELLRAFTEHVALAVRITVDHLAGVLLIRPVLGAPNSETSAQACPVYMQHVYVCIREMCESLGQEMFGRTLVGHSDSMAPEDRERDMGQLIDVVNDLNKPRTAVWTPKP
ncbi:AAA family ATPase [Stenotrophomonas phage BUCTxx99]|nr:AAA family ATPase [Stenotrophomonas phage BUCTxx99]